MCRMHIISSFPNISCGDRKWAYNLFFSFLFLSNKFMRVRGKLRLQHSYKINCIWLILVSWNFMRLCYSWADAVPASCWLNSSSCGLHHPNPKGSWRGSNGWPEIQDALTAPNDWPGDTESCSVLFLLCVILLWTVGCECWSESEVWNTWVTVSLCSWATRCAHATLKILGVDWQKKFT